MAELETAPQPARRSGGRQSRQAQRGNARAQPIIAGIDRQIPAFDLLGEEGLSRIEAAIDIFKILITANEAAGAGDNRDGHGNFRDDKCAEQTPCLA